MGSTATEDTAFTETLNDLYSTRRRMKHFR
jgi:hypothetical protein